MCVCACQLSVLKPRRSEALGPDVRLSLRSWDAVLIRADGSVLSPQPWHLWYVWNIFFSPSTSSLPFIHQWPLYAMVVQVKVHQPEILSYKMLQKKTIKLFRGGLTLPEGRVYKIGFLARALYTLVVNVMSRMEWMACSISMTDYAECWCSHSQLWPKKSHWKYEFSQAKTRTAPFSALRCRVTACTLQTLIHAWLFENCSKAWIKWALLPG